MEKWNKGSGNKRIVLPAPIIPIFHHPGIFGFPIIPLFRSSILPFFVLPFPRTSCKTLESERRSSFRASEARPGIQDFQAILDSGFRRNDGGDDFCKKLPIIPIFHLPAFPSRSLPGNGSIDRAHRLLWPPLPGCGIEPRQCRTVRLPLPRWDPPRRSVSGIS
jgi:hypothetical protein